MKVSAEKVTYEMAKACMTSKELQEAANISDVTLSRIRNGAQQPRPSTIGKLAKALNVPLEALLQEETA